jgi:RHS repeat-associated protein
MMRIGVGSMGGRLFTDKLVFRWLEGFGAWSLDSATPVTSAYPAHASGLSDSVATYTPGILERRNGVSTFLNSGLKDVAKQTDAAGSVTATRKYDAYGMVIGSTGTWKGPFGYSGSAGYQEDETGLQLLGHRYYDSSTGRFITRDPIKDGRNWYVYCDGNPVTRIDSNGLGWHDPMVVYVDPNFKGKVTVIGEPGEGKPQTSTVVKPGQHSHPGMDVDYIIIEYPNGDKAIVFAMGLGTPLNPDNTPQLTTIDKNGKVHTNGGVSTSGDFISVFWLPQVNPALKRPTPKNRLPVNGPYHPGKG